MFVCSFTVCTHSFWNEFCNSFLFLTLSNFKMHAWRHPGKANLHCMLLKYLHMYTTGIKKSSRHTVLKTADTLTKAYKKQLRKKSRLSSAMFFLLPSNGLQLQYFFFVWEPTSFYSIADYCIPLFYWWKYQECAKPKFFLRIHCCE